MKSSVKIALGIDINESHLSTVVLRKTARGLKAISAERTPLPEGVIASGHIVDAGQLAKLLRTVKRRYRVRSKEVAVSLPVKSTLARVVSLEESDPQRISQFLREEVRQYAAFSGRETVSDYRVLSPARGDTPGKALVAGRRSRGDACDYARVPTRRDCRDEGRAGRDGLRGVYSIWPSLCDLAAATACWLY